MTLLWGDSHANHYASAVRTRAGDIDAPVLLYASAGCAPVLDTDLRLQKHCRANNDQVLGIIMRFGVQRVVLSAYWQRIFEENNLKLSLMTDTVQRLRRAGLEVIVIGDNPDFPFSNPQYLALRLARRDDPDAPFYTGVRNDLAFNARLERATRPAAFFDPMEQLCRKNECLASRSGRLMMRDNSHLTTYGAGVALRGLRPFE